MVNIGKFRKRTRCRLCKSRDLKLFLDLGLMPLAGDYLTKFQLGKEKFYPLEVYFCNNCSLVQILNIVEPEILFNDYRYLSSSTQTLAAHFEDFASEMNSKFLQKGDLVVEIGSNDGVLLKPLKDLGLKVIGVDPAKNVNEIARKKGLEVIDGYFNLKTAKLINKKFGKVKAVFANNCLAHIDNLDEIFLSIDQVIEDRGTLVFEVHYLVDLLNKFQFDTIYHEHLCYYSLTALRSYLEKFSFSIFDVKRIPIHSGSIRVYAQKSGGKISKTKNLDKLLRLEINERVKSLKTYLDFAVKVEKSRKSLVELIKETKKRGKSIVAYGAAGRGNILLNYCKFASGSIDYLVDESAERYGRFVPGVEIPIYPVSKFREDYPDYVLILAWSYQKEILEKEKDFIKKGGNFIIPLPTAKVI